MGSLGVLERMLLFVFAGLGVLGLIGLAAIILGVVKISSAGASRTACRACGAMNSGSARFCSQCGEPLTR